MPITTVDDALDASKVLRAAVFQIREQLVSVMERANQLEKTMKPASRLIEELTELTQKTSTFSGDLGSLRKEVNDLNKLLHDLQSRIWVLEHKEAA